jgi:hypothetical protein
MPIFTQRQQAAPKLARGVYTVQRGIGFLQAGDYDNALREFRKVTSSRHPKMSQLVKGVASFFIYNTVRFRKEQEKVRFGNSRLMGLRPGKRGDAWSDVDIAAVLVAPNNPFTTQFLTRFLGRTEEAIRFQRRYAFDRPLGSWAAESGSKYTRFTQNRLVSRKLGLSA